MSSSQKKVIVRRFQGDLRCGYLPFGGFVEDGKVMLLDLDGRLAGLPLEDIKTICYVRDFNLNDPVSPERLQRKAFLARPRGDGLWIRILFREDGDQLEGLAAANKTMFDELAQLGGLHLTPPDVRSNTQRVFVPHRAIASLDIVAVITSPSARLKTSSPPTQGERLPPVQDNLFPPETSSADDPRPGQGAHGSK